MIPGARGGGDLWRMKTHFGRLGPVKGSQPAGSLRVIAKHCLCVLSSAFRHLWKILTRLQQKSKKKVLHITEVFDVPDFSWVSCTLGNSGFCTSALLLKLWHLKPFFPGGHLCSWWPEGVW